MKVEIKEMGVRCYIVSVERLGAIGYISDTRDRPFKFIYMEHWGRLTAEENEAIHTVVKPKVTLLNITRRLTR